MAFSAWFWVDEATWPWTASELGQKRLHFHGPDPRVTASRGRGGFVSPSHG